MIDQYIRVLDEFFFCFKKLSLLKLNFIIEVLLFEEVIFIRKGIIFLNVFCHKIIKR